MQAPPTRRNSTSGNARASPPRELALVRRHWPVGGKASTNERAGQVLPSGNWWCEPATRRSTRTKPQPVLPWPASMRRPPRRASRHGSRCACIRATCATAGTSPRSPSRAGSRRGTATLTGFAPTVRRTFSSGPPKSSQGHAGNGSKPEPFRAVSRPGLPLYGSRAAD